MLKNKSAFSLIELSIVLIIIGLLIAGVSSGSKLIKSATLQSYISELKSFETAYIGFHLSYGCTPGDCKNAEDFFGAENTNNGNGNEIIEWETNDEELLGWNHLALAGLITGSYTYTKASDGEIFMINENIPSSKIAGVGFMLYSEPGEIYNIPGNTYNNLLIGKRRTNSPATNGVYHGAYFTAADAQRVDNKIDDSFPHSGQLLTTPGYDLSSMQWFSAGSNCVTSPTAPSSYILSDKIESCRQVFFFQKY